MTSTPEPPAAALEGDPADLSRLLRPVVRESTVTEVAKRLLDHLAAGNIKPGTRLPAERNLAEALNVARSSVRGALSALDVLGIIEIRPGSGSYVREGTSDFLPQAINWGLMLGQRRTQDLVEVRRYMEGVSARLAAERSGPEDIERLDELHAALRRAGEDGGTEAFVEADIAFHLEIARIAGNSVLSDILHSIRALLQVWMERVNDLEGTVSGTLCEHAAVVEAIRSHDPDGADRAMADHMHNANERLQRTV
ncbi:FadR/GntR family transcriptional regulator [Streptomyces sp. WG-D5]